MIKEIKEDQNTRVAYYLIDEGDFLKRHKWILDSNYVLNRLGLDALDDIDEICYRAANSVYTAIYASGDKETKEYWLSLTDVDVLPALLECELEQLFDTIQSNKEKGVLDDDGSQVSAKVMSMLSASGLIFGDLLGVQFDISNRGVTY